MKLTDQIAIADIGLVVHGHLVLSDIHLGFEESHNKKGIFIPRVLFTSLVTRLREILVGKRFISIILNGDIKHEFGSISSSEWKTILRFLDFLAPYTDALVMVEGNHDPLLHYIAKKRGIILVDHILIDSVYITHGDLIPTNKEFIKAKTIVIGHDHPALGLRHGNRREVYKAFLMGKWKKKKIIVMPSCNLLTEGSDILTTRHLSPFLADGIDDFLVYVVSDTVYPFGHVAKLREMTNR